MTGQNNNSSFPWLIYQIGSHESNDGSFQTRLISHHVQHKRQEGAHCMHLGPSNNTKSPVIVMEIQHDLKSKNKLVSYPSKRLYLSRNLL